MNRMINAIAIAIGVVGMAYGISATYDKYRGTDHSRVPLAQLTSNRGSAAASQFDPDIATLGVAAPPAPQAVTALRPTAPSLSRVPPTN